VKKKCTIEGLPDDLTENQVVRSARVSIFDLTLRSRPWPTEDSRLFDLLNEGFPLAGRSMRSMLSSENEENTHATPNLSSAQLSRRTTTLPTNQHRASKLGILFVRDWLPGRVGLVDAVLSIKSRSRAREKACIQAGESTQDPNSRMFCAMFLSPTPQQQNPIVHGRQPHAPQELIVLRREQES